MGGQTIRVKSIVRIRIPRMKGLAGYKYHQESLGTGGRATCDKDGEKDRVAPVM